MLLQAQCLFLVLANLDLFDDYGDQSVILWKTTRARQSISISETGLKQFEVMKVLRSLRFSPSTHMTGNIYHFCTPGLSKADLQRLQRNRAAIQEYQSSISQFNEWTQRMQKHRHDHFTASVKTKEYEKCIDVYHNKDFQNIAFTKTCSYFQLLQGLAAGQIGIKGKNNCFVPHTGVSFHIFAQHGFPIIISAYTFRYNSPNQSAMFFTLFGQVHRLLLDELTGQYYIDNGNNHSTIRNGVSYDLVYKHWNQHDSIKNYPAGEIFRIVCKTSHAWYSIKKTCLDIGFSNSSVVQVFKERGARRRISQFCQQSNRRWGRRWTFWVLVYGSLEFDRFKIPSPCCKSETPLERRQLYPLKTRRIKKTYTNSLSLSLEDRNACENMEPARQEDTYSAS